MAAVEFGLEVGAVVLVEKCGVEGGAEGVVDAGGEDEVEGAADIRAAGFASGDAVVALVEGGLDVEADPVHEGKDGGEAVGEHAGGVEADAEAHVAHLAHGVGNAALHGGLAAAEGDGLKETLALDEECPQALPCPAGGGGGAEALEVGIVAIATAPRAALAEDDCREPSGVVNGGQRREAADFNERRRRIHADASSIRRSAGARRVRFSFPR